MRSCWPPRCERWAEGAEGCTFWREVESPVSGILDWLPHVFLLLIFFARCCSLLASVTACAVHFFAESRSCVMKRSLKPLVPTARMTRVVNSLTSFSVNNIVMRRLFHMTATSCWNEIHQGCWAWLEKQCIWKCVRLNTHLVHSESHQQPSMHSLLHHGCPQGRRRLAWHATTLGALPGPAAAPARQAATSSPLPPWLPESLLISI